MRNGVIYMKIGLQTYTMRKFYKDEQGIDKAFGYMHSIGLKYIQCSALGKFEPELVKRLADKHQLEIVGTHYGYKELKNDVDRLIKVHQIYGCKYIGIGMIPRDCLKTRETAEAFVKDFNELGKIYKEAGLTLVYHNHAAEFKKYGDKTIFDMMCEEFTDVKFCLDCFWAYKGCKNVEACMDQIGDRLVFLHLKGCKMLFGKIMIITPLSDGVLDMKSYMTKAEGLGCEHTFIELDIAKNIYKDVKSSFDYLTKLVK